MHAIYMLVSSLANRIWADEFRFGVSGIHAVNKVKLPSLHSRSAEKNLAHGLG